MEARKEYALIQEEAKARVTKEIEAFCDEVLDRTSNLEHFMSISDLEDLLRKHRTDVTQVYTDTLSELLASINQSELIKRKKANTKERG